MTGRVKDTYFFVNGRVFIDIAYGCGNGCSYCYSQHANEFQVAYRTNTLNKIITAIINDKRFVKGKAGTLISLCPNTEPLKTREAAIALLFVIEKLSPIGNRIQISTKSIISDFFINEINKLNIPVGQITMFISISSLSNYDKYEPNTPNIYQRIGNIIKLKNTNIKTCLYIKPFLLLENDIKYIIDTVNKTTPDAVCIGMQYFQGGSGNYRHPVNISSFSEGISSAMKIFKEKYDSNKPLFLTSSCVVSYINRCALENISIPQQFCLGCKCSCKKCEKWLSQSPY